MSTRSGAGAGPSACCGLTASDWPQAEAPRAVDSVKPTTSEARTDDLCGVDAKRDMAWQEAACVAGTTP